MSVRIPKIISIFLLTFSAILGLIFDFKNNGSLNSWGYVVFGITIISGLIAVITEILEYKTEKKRSL